MNQKYYSFLMQRVVVDSDIFVFKPVSLIEGYMEEYIENKCCFVTPEECSYYFADDLVSLDGDISYVAYKPVTEEDLMSMYNVDTIDEAKIEYVNDIFEHVYFGVSSYDENKVTIVNFSINELVTKAIYGENINIGVDTAFVLENEEQVFVGVDEIEKLLEIDNFNELKESLSDLIERVNRLRYCYEEESKVDSNHIRELFQKVYKRLLAADDIKEIKQLIGYIEDTYLDLTYNLDNIDADKREKVTNSLIEIAESFSKLLELNSLEEIKKNILFVRQAAEVRNERIIEMYEKNEVIEYSQNDLEESIEETSSDLIDIKKIKKYFDDKIIGQEEAKRDVISAIFMNKLLDDPANKNNCLLVGPTGSGKTLLAETVAEFFDMPIEIIDTTQLTVPGYVGANIEDFLARLISKTKGDITKAENGIVVFDEIDKKGTMNNADISGKGVLNTLLPFISGTTYDVSYNNRNVNFNTSKLTIFATGAFTEIANSSDNVYSKGKIGFDSNLSEQKEDIKYHQFSTDDYVKKGNMPAELIGRFSVITQLSGHTKESLRKILTESNASALLSEKKKLEKINIELRWTDGYLDEVANKALKLKTGARSLKSTIDKSIKEARWEVLSNLDIYKAIILTEKTVLNNKDCLLVDINGNSHNLSDILNAKDKTAIKVYQK